MLGPIPLAEPLEFISPESTAPGPKFLHLPELECCEASPRSSTGPSANSLASSSSEVASFADFLANPLADSNLGSAHIHQAKEQQSAGAVLRRHQQQHFWPEANSFLTQGTCRQLPLVNLDQDLMDALGMLDSPDSSDPPLNLPSPLAIAAVHAPPTQQPSLSSREQDGSGDGSSDNSKSKKRPVGRPRAKGPSSSAGGSGCSSGGQLATAEAKEMKRGRGPKPKYVFSSTDEALDARRERNRKAALDSYYRKRERLRELETEAKQLAAENEALEQLLKDLEAGKVQLSEPTNDGIDAWLSSRN